MNAARKQLRCAICVSRVFAGALAVGASVFGAPPTRASSNDEPPALSEDMARVQADEAARIAAFDRAARSVVCIYADNRRTGGGSGVIFDERGYGLTNFHVVAEFVETRRGVGGLSDGNLYALTVLGIDPGGDIALFKLHGKPRFDAAPLGDSDALVVGQWVAAMGNPFLLTEDYTPTITLGVISGLHRYQEGQGNALEYADCIQVSSSINPGNSGGPLFDLAGRIIGINGRASFEERGRVNVGLGYAVSINQIKRFLPGLRAGRLCEHGTLGATVSVAGDELIFDAVQDAAPASIAGVQLGDVLLAVNGRSMRTANDFNNVMAIMPADWPVRLSLRRGEQVFDLSARLERLPIRKLPAFILDLKHNHAELRLILDAARLRLLGEQHGSVPLRWRGRELSDRGESIGECYVEHDDAGAMTVWSGDRQRLLFVSSESPESDAVPEPWREWRGLIAPLVVPPALSVGWEFVGGDEIEGRIVCVVERRLESEERIRWSFDAVTSELIEVSIDRSDGRVLWRPDAPSDSVRPFVRTWRRYAPDGWNLITVENLEDSGSMGESE